MFAVFLTLVIVCCLQIECPRRQLAAWKPGTKPFDYDSKSSEFIDYKPTELQPGKQWHLCISYPHMKDAYWLNVNYGMIQEAKRLGIAFTLGRGGWLSESGASKTADKTMY